MVFKIFFLQFNWLGSNKKRSDNQANSRWWLKNSSEIIHLDRVGISLYNLGVYFQSNTGKLISQLITLVVAVRLFSFFVDENLTSSAKIGSTVNVKIGITLDGIYILADISHSQIMSNLYISAGLKWNCLLQPAFSVAHIPTDLFQIKVFFLICMIHLWVVPGLKDYCTSKNLKTQVLENQLSFALYFMLLYLWNYEWKAN